MNVKAWLAPVLLGVVLFTSWIIASASGAIDPHSLPAPAEVGERLRLGFEHGYLSKALGHTLLEAVLGCCASAFIGIPTGFALAHSRLFSASIEPYLAASQAVPAIAIAPLLVTWVGYGTTPIVVLCVIMVVFPVIVSSAVGVRSIKPELLAAARLDGAHGWLLVRAIELPLAGPFILAGLRTGFTLAMTGAVVGEMVIGGEAGLGLQIVTAQHLNDTAGMFAAIFLLAAIAIAIYLLIMALERNVMKAVEDI